MKKYIYNNIIKKLVNTSWRAYVIMLVGFLMGTFSGKLGEYYGVWVGLSAFILGWWMCLASLLIQNSDDMISIRQLFIWEDDNDKTINRIR